MVVQTRIYLVLLPNTQAHYDFLTFPAAFGLAPLSRSSSATSTFPYLEATWSGVKPFCRRTNRKVYKTSGRGFYHLGRQFKISQQKVEQEVFTLVILVCWASMSRRIRTVCTWPSRAAICRGVCPAVVVELGLAFCSSRSFTSSLWPIRAAQCRGVWSSCTGGKLARGCKTRSASSAGIRVSHLFTGRLCFGV